MLGPSPSDRTPESHTSPRYCINGGAISAPTVTNVDVPYEDLIDLLGKRLSLEECVDRITFMGAGPEGVQDGTMTFDIFPNRPDLYSVEGIARGLRGFLGLELGLPRYSVGSATTDFIVNPNVADVRPFALGGIVRGLDLDTALLRSLVDLQEKLHLTVGRKRRKVAIGIHDLDRVTAPFTYKAVLPPEVRFTPLGLAEDMDLLDILVKHEKGREYAHLVASQPVFPIITDAKGNVLSFPPVINGVLTQLTPDTRNVFIDVTGTDLEAVGGCLSIIATSLAARGGKIELVRTKFADRTLETPDLAPRQHTLDLRRANELLGLSLRPNEAIEFLRRMRHDARAEGEVITASSPAYRLDLLHAVDLTEDIAIAWGYDRYPRGLPKRMTIGEALAAKNIRRIAAAAMHHKAAFTEAKSLVLSLLRDLGQSGEVTAVDDANFIPGRAAAVVLHGRDVGRFGEIHPRILEAYTLVQPVVAFELDVTLLRSAPN